MGEGEYVKYDVELRTSGSGLVPNLVPHRYHKLIFV
jgi:hypothetical protein